MSNKEKQELDKGVQLMEKAQYVKSIIATALKNGMSFEEMTNTDVKELMKLHHHSQLKAIKKAGEELQEQYLKPSCTLGIK